MAEARTPFSLKEFYGNMAVYWFDSNGKEIESAAELTGELRILLCGYDAAGVEEIFLEDDGTLKNSNYGWNGSAVTRFLLETTGEQKNVIHGKDSSSNIDPLRTNDDKELIVDVKESTSRDRRVADYVAITDTLADVWDPNALYSLTNTSYLDVELFISNITSATDGILKFIGVDLADAGTIDGIWAAEIPMPAGEVGKSLGIFRIGGDDVIMAQADANTVLQLHIRIVEEGTAL